MGQTTYKKSGAITPPENYVGTGIDENGNFYKIDENGNKTYLESGGSAYLLTLAENPTYNTDGTIKTMKHSYVSDPTKYYEERFEYTNGLATKIEIKDDLAGVWVQKTDIYNASEQLQKPTVATITAWTII